jgi:DNA-binding NarL/FixJ family response regulator
MSASLSNTILIIDDSVFIGKKLINMIKDIPTVKVIVQATTVRESYALISQHLPDIILLDLSLPDGSGFDILKYVHKEFPAITVIVLSNSGEYYQQKALEFGAQFCLDKTKDFSHLVTIIEEITLLA